MRSLEMLSREEKKNLIHDILDKKNGLSDLDWADLINRYDLDIHVDTLRRAAIGVKMFDDVHDDTVSDGGYIERQKVRDLTSKLNNIYRSQSRSELMRETVAEAISKLKPLETPSLNAFVKCGRSSFANRSLVVAIGDFHYGADIVVNGMNGENLNTFNTDVFRNRMMELLEEIQWIALKEDITRIDVLMVGDLIDGMIHQNQLSRLELGLVEQVIGLSEMLSTWIQKLSEEQMVAVHAVNGNHSEIRPFKSKPREFEDENLEKIIFWFMKERLKNNHNVTINADCEPMKMTSICGYNFLMMHGDGKKSIANLTRDAVNLYGKKIDYVVCGHDHCEQEFASGNTPDGNSVIIRVPSICGMSRYAQIHGYGGKPGATVLLMEEGYGRRCVYPIQLH